MRERRPDWGALVFSKDLLRDSEFAHCFPWDRLLACHGRAEAHCLSEKLQYQASHDALTGLYNRRELERRLQRVVDAASKTDTENALCFLDLDQFKVVNDTCGHVAGDELLRQMAQLLSVPDGGGAARDVEVDTQGRGDVAGIVALGQFPHAPVEPAGRPARHQHGLVALDPESTGVDERLFGGFFAPRGLFLT